MKCERCSINLPDSASFCPKCGTKAAPGKVAEQVPGTAKTADEPNYKMIFVALAAAAALIALLWTAHICAWCGKPFLGDGYWDVSGTERICEDCATDYYGPYKAYYEA